MEVTLRELLENDDKNRSLLEIKLRLQNLKKNGVMFYRENIVLLLENQAFAMWYALDNGEQKLTSAVPVHKSAYRVLRDKQAHQAYVKHHFEQYYGQTPTESEILQFTGKYISKDFVWYYRPLKDID